MNDTRHLRCPLCGSLNCYENVAHTIFCNECRYAVTARAWNVERMRIHPLHAELGFAIKPSHPDADVAAKAARRKGERPWR